MQFVVLLKATTDSEAGIFRPEQFNDMGAFNEGLAKDGVLLAAEGLKPSSNGARLRFADGRATVTDGPFTETKELVAGFWIVSGKSQSEVVERFKHTPLASGQELEIRPLYSVEDFSPEVMTPERREKFERVSLADLAKPGAQTN